MALSTAIFELAASSAANATLIATASAQLGSSKDGINESSEEDDNDLGDDNSNTRSDKLGLVVIFTGFALGVFLVCFILICCKFFAKVSESLLLIY